MSVGRFLCGIAALIRHPDDGRYLLLRRSSGKDYGPGAWESVTGRVDQGESFSDALHREVLEEVGLRVRLDHIVGTTHFYRGAPTPDNELLGVIFACTAVDPQALRTSAEHDDHRWLTAAEIEAQFPADFWLRRAIERAGLLYVHAGDVVRERYAADGGEF